MLAMQASIAPGRWPASLPPSPTKHQYLQHTMSMSDLQNEQSWQWPRSPPSPTTSSSSSLSRSTTPRNPWSSSSTSTSPSTSPSERSSSSPKARSPPSTSRCPTPLAPQPLRPSFPTARGSSHSWPFGNISTADIPASPTPTPYTARESPSILSAASLCAAYITPALITQLKLHFPSLLSRQGWERSTAQRAYGWALQNPKTALLLLMCDDIASWPRAVIFGLDDDKLPLQESDFDGIATDPRKAVDLQWKVMVKELPQHGQHIEFQAYETVPLQHVSLIRSSGNESKGLDKVRWFGDQEDRVHVRKWLVVSRQPQKMAVLSQIQSFKKLDHPNIAKILCSYSHGTVVSLVTPSAQCSLEDFLHGARSGDQSRILLDWINDLTQAVAYLHSKDIAHRSIQPRKFLIKDNRIFLSVFGINADTDNKSCLPTEPDQCTYAAPETLTRHKLGRQADVFSLGRVFLDMLCVARGHGIATLHAFLGAPSSPTFHASASRTEAQNVYLSRIAAWIKQERAALADAALAPSAHRNEKLTLERAALALARDMLAADPSSRPKLRIRAPQVANKWTEARAVQRRRSFDAVDVGVRWAELSTLEGYYAGR